ncbi:LysR substrate-binding domain-containing protein [Chromobacterium violaceum]|uniref:LysR substrate-binding domain-containing protein n=1 Tax=Chromobacterium violaceum TaxID=536 RepID=UPI001C8C7540|nr:LysR substrate-binding domain-containing protein [Chromobacterium violaceum]MBX9265994.1 hypothetical protein [Chromobacterium violaceum]
MRAFYAQAVGARHLARLHQRHAAEQRPVFRFRLRQQQRADQVDAQPARQLDRGGVDETFQRGVGHVDVAQQRHDLAIRSSRELPPRLPCVVHSRYHGGARWRFERDGRAEEVEVAHWLQVSDYSLNRKLAEAGAGFARLPDFVAGAALLGGRLVRVLAGWETPARPVYLVYPKKTPQPAKSRALIDFCAEWFAGPASPPGRR